MFEDEMIKRVDVALIFMLKEEKDLFINYNKAFIVFPENELGFNEFVFFDKDNKQRTGVMCSNLTEMGNTEAGILFYTLSRNYKAHLYINLGVAGLITDLQIGDVLIATRIATMGENNANNTQKQLIDLSNYSKDVATQARREIESNLTDDFFVENTKRILQFKKDIESKAIDLSKYDLLEDLKENKVCNGWCVTVSEVIKDKEKLHELSNYRKINVIDMEAYYFGLWHNLIKKTEKNNSMENSIYLAFKSVSDYGDENKKVMEECGSRKIAMENLYNVVSVFCTKVYVFPCSSEISLLDYFSTHISNESLDEFIKKNNDIDTDTLDSFFSNFIYSSDSMLNVKKIVSSSISILDTCVLYLTGRSGSGKSTFMSYLYTLLVKQGKKAFLIDVSHFNDTTVPTEKQVMYWLKVLTNTVKDLYIFVDGLSRESYSYECMKNMLSEMSNNNIGICVGNYSGKLNGDLDDAISSRYRIVEVLFYGVNIHSNNFSNYISQGELFFKKSFSAEQVKKFIIDSKITNVDFRLLNMISNYEQDITSHKTLHNFIRNYILNKFNISNIEKYCCFNTSNEFSGHLKTKFHNDKLKINRNFYAHTLAIAGYILDIFSKKNYEKIDEFIHKEFILSNDMNLIFDNSLRLKRDRIEIINFIVSVLKNNFNEINISVITQMLYNICSVLKEGDLCSSAVKDLVCSQLNTAKSNIANTSNIQQKNWILSYRTMCIIMNFFFGERQYLKSFNSMLLTNSDYASCNLLFHLFYYSKMEFSFSQLFSSGTDNIDFEMFQNTYYMLKNSIFNEKQQIEKLFISQDVFFEMNVITFYHLIQLVLAKSNEFGNFLCDAIETSRMLYNQAQIIKKKNSTYINENLFALMNEVNFQLGDTSPTV